MRNDDDLGRSNFDNDDAENKSPNSRIAQFDPAVTCSPQQYSDGAGQM
jgi:hypothetical protein